MMHDAATGQRLELISGLADQLADRVLARGAPDDEDWQPQGIALARAAGLLEDYDYPVPPRLFEALDALGTSGDTPTEPPAETGDDWVSAA